MAYIAFTQTLCTAFCVLSPNRLQYYLIQSITVCIAASPYCLENTDKTKSERVFKTLAVLTFVSFNFEDYLFKTN